ncbi:MAG TPA: FkbM family methyltransferase [Devosia sp.]|jgi:FkbM family methyltransferase|nr:FkbM family methyltransferase [Devosia sp.]
MTMVNPDRLSTPMYRNTRLKKVLAQLAIPVFGLLNRPALRWWAEAAYDVALRWNGFAIAFPGKEGLTHPEEAFLKRFLPDLGPGTVLDVGANHGSYTRFLAGRLPNRQIFSFEPHPRTFAVLCGSASFPNVTLVNMALSDTPGTMELYDFAQDDGSSQASLSRDAVALFDSEIVQHSVECTTLDAFAAAHDIDQIAFIKVDTEGFDINVLRGARGLLAAGRIAAIQFEFIPTNIATRVTIRDFFELLEGYDLFRLCVSGRLWPLPHYNVKRCEVYVIHNIIALRRQPG